MSRKKQVIHVRQKSAKKDVGRLLRKFHNAQRRTRFWSGTPSYSAARARARNSGEMHEKYELAMCDQKSLAGLLSDLGSTVKVRDYRQEFAARFSKLMRKA